MRTEPLSAPDPSRPGLDLDGGSAPMVVRERLLVLARDPGVHDAVYRLSVQQVLAVTSAESLTEAVFLAERHPGLEAALVALGPGLPGPAEVVRQLREATGASRLPVAFISAERDVVARLAAADAGASLFLEAPLDDAALAVGLRQLLARRPAHARVLVAGEPVAGVVSVLVQAGYEVVTASAPERLLSELVRVRPEALLISGHWAGLRAPDACRLVRMAPGFAELPILLLEAADAPGSGVAAYRAGADDALAATVTPDELCARLAVRLERFRLMRDRAERDSLTGLLLRVPLMEALHGRLAEAARRGRPVAVCLLDLDQFKAINDRYGHLAGDRVLATFGRLASARFRPSDLRGRWGGEEFLLAFPNETGETASPALERFLEEFQALTFDSPDGGRFRASFSAGLATFSEDGTTPDALLRVADHRCYRAKGLGRGRVVSSG